MLRKLFPAIVIIAALGMVVCGCSKDSDTVQKEQVKQENASASKTEAAISQKVSNEATQAKEYVDGVYEGKSEVTGESYYATAQIVIQNNKIKSADVKIVDGDVSKRIYYSLNAMDKDVLKKLDGVKERIFDESYGTELFPGNEGNNPHYREQCKNDLAGLKSYIEKLAREQDINKVDAITGATWSNMLFKGAVLDALQKAEKK